MTAIFFFFSFVSQFLGFRNVNSVAVSPLTFCLSCLDMFKDFGQGRFSLLFLRAFMYKTAEGLKLVLSTSQLTEHPVIS